MATLSIMLPSNTFVTNGKHVTFKAPCNSKGVTRILIGNDKQAYELRDSRQRVLPEDVIVFEKGVMVSVILDTENHFAYLQSGGGTAESEEGVTCVVDFNGRQGSVEPMTGDYTAEMVGASPAIHANQHALNGADPITPASIGAATVDHKHEGLYASVTHTHSNYALSGHAHDGTYAPNVHSHDDSYSLKDHNHEGIYAPYNHSHGEDGSIGFNQEDADKLYAAISHTHSLEELGAAATTHTHKANEIGAAEEGHTHTASEVGAAGVDHTHNPADIGAAEVSHTHTASEVGAAEASHTHEASEINGVALAQHTHTVDEIEGLDQEILSGEYLPLSGGQLTGSIDMNGNKITNASKLSLTYVDLMNGTITHDDGSITPILSIHNAAGPLLPILRGISAPVGTNDAATKSYVDTTVANAVADAIAAIPVYNGAVS